MDPNSSMGDFIKISSPRFQFFFQSKEILIWLDKLDKLEKASGL